MPNTTPTPAEVRAEVPEEIGDRWIEAMQIATGSDDNPGPEGRAQMAEVRGRMLATRDAAVRAAAIREAAGMVRAASESIDPEFAMPLRTMRLNTADALDRLAPTTTPTPEEH